MNGVPILSLMTFLPAAGALSARAGASRRIWYVGAHAAQKLASRAFKARVGVERWWMFRDPTPASLLRLARRGLAAFRLPQAPVPPGPESTFR